MVWECVCVCVCVCVCGWNELEVCTTLAYIYISVHSVHKHTHTCILKPFEDSEPTGLKVDIACKLACRAWKSRVSGTWCLWDHCPSVVMKTSRVLYTFVFLSHFKHSILSITVICHSVYRTLHLWFVFVPLQKLWFVFVPLWKLLQFTQFQLRFCMCSCFPAYARVCVNCPLSSSQAAAYWPQGTDLVISL